MAVEQDKRKFIATKLLFLFFIQGTLEVDFLSFRALHAIFILVDNQPVLEADLQTLHGRIYELKTRTTKITRIKIFQIENFGFQGQQNKFPKLECIRKIYCDVLKGLGEKNFPAVQWGKLKLESYWTICFGCLNCRIMG